MEKEYFRLGATSCYQCVADDSGIPKMPVNIAPLIKKKKNTCLLRRCEGQSTVPIGLSIPIQLSESAFLGGV
jgi:hypothetical protein